MRRLRRRETVFPVSWHDLHFTLKLACPRKEVFAFFADAADRIFGGIRIRTTLTYPQKYP